MAASSKSPSPSAPIHANSPRNRHHSRRSAAASGESSPSAFPLLGSVDHEQFVTSSSATSSDTFSSNEDSKIFATSSSLVEDVSDAGADALLDDSDNDSAGKKIVRNNPSNGLYAEAGDVMWADSWPALSEFARASPNSSSTSSPKSISSGSIIVSEGMAGSFSSQKVTDTSTTTSNLTSDHVNPMDMKRGGDSSNQSSKPANGGLSQALPQSARSSGGFIGESNRDKTHRDVGQKGRFFGGNVQQQHNHFRSNNWPQARGDGSYHHRHGVGHYPRRSFGGWESLPSQKRDASRTFIRGSAPNAPFVPPSFPPVGMRPFLTPIAYQEMPTHLFCVTGPHPGPMRSIPMVPYSPMLFPMPDPHLTSKILNQIDYYFSNENLVKDTFLRQNMDGEGWVSIKLIAGFKRVIQLTDNIHLILNALQASNIVEVQGYKVRCKNDWIKWIMPPAQISTVTNHSIHGSSQDILAEHHLGSENIVTH